MNELKIQREKNTNNSNTVTTYGLCLGNPSGVGRDLNYLNPRGWVSQSFPNFVFEFWY